MFRIDEFDSVYLYSEQHEAYLFVGKLNGRTLEQFIEQFEGDDL